MFLVAFLIWMDRKMQTNEDNYSIAYTVFAYIAERGKIAVEKMQAVYGRPT